MKRKTRKETKKRPEKNRSTHPSNYFFTPRRYAVCRSCAGSEERRERRRERKRGSRRWALSRLNKLLGPGEKAEEMCV